MTAESPYAHHAEPAFAPDGTRIIMECGDRPYGEAGTALCEVGLDGSNFQVILTPEGVASGVPSAALRQPDYTPDGAIVFEASWDGTIWRLPADGAPAELVSGRFKSDGAPCVLPDGRIASLWLGRPNNEGVRELKLMSPDGVAHTMLVTSIDVEQIDCGGP